LKEGDEEEKNKLCLI